MKTINNGFTLLEVIIVMSLLVVMIGGAMSVMFSAQQTFDEGSMTSFLESQASRLIDVMKDDISEGLVITGTSVPTTANNYASLTIKVPVLVGGNYWNPVTGAVYWGAEGTQDWYMTYTFALTSVLYETNPLDPTDKKDYNSDGDVTDSFDIGEMVKNVYNAGGVLQQSTKICNDIITVATTRYLDINEDGNDDRIFTYCNKDGQSVDSGGIGVIVNIWLGGKLGAKQNPIIVNTTTTIMLMNPQ